MSSTTKRLHLGRCLLSIIYIFSLTACDQLQVDERTIDQHSYELGVVSGFSELINAGVKQLALSAPLSPTEMDAFIGDATKVAAKHKVSIERESALIVSDLFPADIASGKDVLLLFQGATLDAYQTLKADQAALQKAGTYDRKARIAIARRFGRLLSYSPRKINQLLAQNTAFRTMDDFGIQATNLFLYYQDLEKAGTFYTQTLGMELVADYKMAQILRMTADSYLILVDASKGMHTVAEPKTVALALLTEQLDEWYAHLKANKVTIKYDYKPKVSGAHDGFVIVDPEGYLLEFERFKQHPENEKFIPLLDKNISKSSQIRQGKMVAKNLGIHSTITWLYYKDVLAMQNYFQDLLGLTMVADQGWTKIYQASETGFMAIVDERRGMHSFTEKKAVNVGFIINELEDWYTYVKEHQVLPLRSKELTTGPEGRYKAFVGYDPEAYYLEFDHFYPHEDNKLLLKYLEGN